MQIAIVDDEKDTARLLVDYVQRYEKEYHISLLPRVFYSGMDFLENYNKEFDIVCMDIEMPGLDGMSVSKRLREIDKDVVLIFITNMAQYALKGYEVDAIDFVIKPIGYGDFALKMQKAIRFAEKFREKVLAIHAVTGLHQLKLSEIYYVEVMQHYLIFHTRNEEYKVRGTISELQKELEPFFGRCNKSFLVNFKYVEAVSGNFVIVAGQELPIGRRMKRLFLEDFTRYTGGIR